MQCATLTWLKATVIVVHNQQNVKDIGFIRNAFARFDVWNSTMSKLQARTSDSVQYNTVTVDRI